MKYEPLISDTYFHIYNRGNNKEDIFKEDRNYDYFLKLLSKYIIPVCEIYAYCLLKNHFHLIVKTKSEVEGKSISQGFSNMFNTYSKAINKSYCRTVSLFTDRFSRKKIDNEKYLKQLIIYTHLNPQHHGLIDDFEDYKYSSYKSYLSDQSSRLDRPFILSLFDGKLNFEEAHKFRKFEIEEKLTLE